MLIFGDKRIKSENFYHIYDIDAITKTPPSSLIYLDGVDKNLDIITYLRANNISFALAVESIVELIYAHNLAAKYIFVNKSLAKSAQDIAESYLFDAKIIVPIQNIDEIEELALLGIDGVAFSSAIIKIAA
jgi:hypothetical protein